MIETTSAKPSGLTLTNIAKPINVREETIKPALNTLVELARLESTGRGKQEGL